MAQKPPGLDAAYALETPDDNRELYRDWAETYDSDFATQMDYRLPFRVAETYAAAGGDAPVLDVGAGTGLVAQRLAELGIGPVDATDISPEMLDVARAKGLYRDLFTADITARSDVPDSHYAGIISSGTFTLGHVGPDAIDELLRIAAPGALFALSINAAHWHSAGFAAKFAELEPQITGLSLVPVRIYGENAQGEHATDEGNIAVFRKNRD